MALPPKPILIRIVIYGSLISFFGWQACQSYMQRADADEVEQAGDTSDPLQPNSSIKLKDGSEMPVLELTSEEFEARFGYPPPATAVTADELEAAVVEAEKRHEADAEADEAPAVADLPQESPEPPADVEPEVKLRLQPGQGSQR